MVQSHVTFSNTVKLAPVHVSLAFNVWFLQFSLDHLDEAKCSHKKLPCVQNLEPKLNILSDLLACSRGKKKKTSSNEPQCWDLSNSVATAARLASRFRGRFNKN